MDNIFGIGRVAENLSDEEYFLRQRAKIILEDNYLDTLFLEEENNED